jgi:hypothetical protein
VRHIPTTRDRTRINRQGAGSVREKNASHLIEIPEKRMIGWGLRNHIELFAT